MSHNKLLLGERNIIIYDISLFLASSPVPSGSIRHILPLILNDSEIRDCGWYEYNGGRRKSGTDVDFVSRGLICICEMKIRLELQLLAVTWLNQWVGGGYFWFHLGMLRLSKCLSMWQICSGRLL